MPYEIWSETGTGSQRLCDGWLIHYSYILAVPNCLYKDEHLYIYIYYDDANASANNADTTTTKAEIN